MANPKKGTAAEEASAMGERATGAAKEGWGKLTGDEATRREGQYEQDEGRARQASNEVFDRDPSERRWVTGTFKDRESAERAYNSLTGRGYGEKDVNLLMSDETRKKHFTEDGRETELGNKALEGAGTGAAIGGAVGATLAAIAAIGTTLALPGLGLLIAGPIAAGLAGAGAGGATGGLIGALIGSGIPEERVKKYEEGIKKGGIMMGVTPRNSDDAAYFEEDWKRNRGEEVYR